MRIKANKYCITFKDTIKYIKRVKMNSLNKEIGIFYITQEKELEENDYSYALDWFHMQNKTKINTTKTIAT